MQDVWEDDLEPSQVDIESSQGQVDVGSNPTKGSPEHSFSHLNFSSEKIRQQNNTESESEYKLRNSEKSESETRLAHTKGLETLDTNSGVAGTVNEKYSRESETHSSQKAREADATKTEKSEEYLPLNAYRRKKREDKIMSKKLRERGDFEGKVCSVCMCMYEFI